MNTLAIAVAESCQLPGVEFDENRVCNYCLDGVLGGDPIRETPVGLPDHPKIRSYPCRALKISIVDHDT